MKIPTLSLRPNPRKIKKRKRKAAHRMPRRVKRARRDRVRRGKYYVIECITSHIGGRLAFSYLGPHGHFVETREKGKKFSTEHTATRAARGWMKTESKRRSNLVGTRVIPA